jgi:formamidopyrimidine-DNA glycosylase
MPEGPEVREFFLYIKPIITGKTIKEIKVLSGKFLGKKPIKNIENVRGVNVKSCFIKGKTIFLEFKFENEEQNTPVGMSFVHGMSGYWSNKLEKHSRLHFKLKENENDNEEGSLYYNDIRNFGRINVYMKMEELRFAKDHLGPDVLDDSISYTDFCSRLNKRGRSKLGTVLLDQKVLAGIGNYLRCDILWYIQNVYGYYNVNHKTFIGLLTEQEKLCLYEVTINMCRYRAGLSYKLELSLDDFYVYGRDYDIYEKPVHRETFGGRTIHYTL